MKTHWRIIKTNTPRNPWRLEGNVFYDDVGGGCAGWQTWSTYPTRKAAIHTGMLLRERGEPISWPGGAIRMGLALVQSCNEAAS